MNTTTDKDFGIMTKEDLLGSRNAGRVLFLAMCKVDSSFEELGSFEQLKEEDRKKLEEIGVQFLEILL